MPGRGGFGTQRFADPSPELLGRGRGRIRRPRRGRLTEPPDRPERPSAELAGRAGRAGAADVPATRGASVKLVLGGSRRRHEAGSSSSSTPVAPPSRSKTRDGVGRSRQGQQRSGITHSGPVTSEACDGPGQRLHRRAPSHRFMSSSGAVRLREPTQRLARSPTDSTRPGPPRPADPASRHVTRHRHTDPAGRPGVAGRRSAADRRPQLPSQPKPPPDDVPTQAAPAASMARRVAAAPPSATAASASSNPSRVSSTRPAA